ncbi:outer membrane beta-barrel protein [Sediminitomix flava]|uniref:Outer membrane protein with beta-barrel domain n=1 Tax=Sediminitomix flava TaxID=379075 RepID=A0A315ZCH9_SEDFL|nr:outer membrane beta-barrel protein [Sediminitomix flava]PWJ42803.1 outer membrane protein with beta-barrel domain [Sediminitomix flava]
MKKLFYFLILFLMSHLASSQDRQGLSFSFSPVKSTVRYFEALDGAASTDGKSAKLFGVNYHLFLGKKFALRSGLNYGEHILEITPAFTGEDRPSYDIEVILYSIPVYLDYSFNKYFYMGAGALFDFEFNGSSDRGLDDQTGIGFGGHLGTKYQIWKIFAFAEGFVRAHSIFPQAKTNHQEHLMERGFNFGIGYTF